MKTTNNTTTETPIMKQYNDLKKKHPDALLLFRCGDFYETYNKDAKDAAKILGITLTKRNNGASQGDAMAGFPYHALDTYLPMLVRAGKRVAICDQLEDPKSGKKLAKRGIVEDVKPAVQEPAEQNEKQPENMTIAELMAAYKSMAAENQALREQLEESKGVSSIELKTAEERYLKESEKAEHWMKKYQDADSHLRKVLEALTGYEYEVQQTGIHR